jgi:hypothetical protein
MKSFANPGAVIALVALSSSAADVEQTTAEPHFAASPNVRLWPKADIPDHGMRVCIPKSYKVLIFDQRVVVADLVGTLVGTQEF